jgi:hypothetical protein
MISKIKKNSSLINTLSRGREHAEREVLPVITACTRHTKVLTA